MGKASGCCEEGSQQLKHALVGEPGARYRGCISSHPLRHAIDLILARAQHGQYCKVLAEVGLEVIKLPRDDEHPDGCFVEDTAVIHGGKAFIARMAKTSRRGEEDAVERVLKEYLPVRRARAPATIEGGDVIHLPDSLISGITQRTTNAGVTQMREWLGVPVEAIADPSIVHLKSHVTYLGKNTFIATKAYASHPVLKGFHVLTVPNGESYAANTLSVGEIVMVPAGHPKTQAMLVKGGFDVIAMDVSEFAKCEGALTCLSLLF
jgi:dimethylargininase